MDKKFYLNWDGSVRLCSEKLESPNSWATCSDGVIHLNVRREETTSPSSWEMSSGAIIHLSPRYVRREKPGRLQRTASAIFRKQGEPESPRRFQRTSSSFFRKQKGNESPRQRSRRNLLTGRQRSLSLSRPFRRKRRERSSTAPVIPKLNLAKEKPRATASPGASPGRDD